MFWTGRSGCIARARSKSSAASQKACNGKMKIVTTPSDSRLAIVDSSGWVEFMGSGPKADSFARYLNFPEHLLLPSVIVFEVYKKLFREQGKNLRSEEHTSELQSQFHLVCRLLLEKKNDP